MTEESGARAIDFQPSVTIALSDDCRLQARVDVVTRTNSYQVRTGDYADDVDQRLPDPPAVLGRPAQAGRWSRCCRNSWPTGPSSSSHSYILPRVLKPISSAIASRS